MNRVVHFEIHAKDPDKVQAFYQEVFGWTMQDMGANFGNYRVIMTGPLLPDPTDPSTLGINGGMNSVPDHTPTEGQPINAFVCIIGVDDVAAAVERVERAGGIVVQAIMDVPTVGRLAYCKDIEGTMFGILEPLPQSIPVQSN